MDILCTRCGEPWDVYSLTDDMSREEAAQLKAGDGCPCCSHLTTIQIGNIHIDRRESMEIQKALAEVLGDNIDGLAGMMEDAGLV